MHVAMFSSNYPPHTGGLEVMARQLATGLARRHRVTVIASAWGTATGASVEDAVHVFRLPTIHLSERWGVPYPVPMGVGIREALAAVSSADVFHAQGALYPSTLMAAWMARRYEAPLVLTEHVGFVEYRSRFIDRIQRAAWACIGEHTIRACQGVAVYNSRVSDWLTSRFPSIDLTYIGNGVDTSTFQPATREQRQRARAALGLPADATIVLFVGREAEKKNLDALLAVPRDDFLLVLCGARRAEVPPRVADLGIVPHGRMAEVYASADLMVLPSSGEGFPLAAQEAMASGVPLVLLWDRGYEQWLEREAVAACGSMAELSHNIQVLVDCASRRARLAVAGRRWAVRSWSWAATVTQYEALYHRARGKVGPRACLAEPDGAARA